MIYLKAQDPLFYVNYLCSSYCITCTFGKGQAASHNVLAATDAVLHREPHHPLHGHLLPHHPRQAHLPVRS
jgi:hypothetical protein